MKSIRFEIVYCILLAVLLHLSGCSSTNEIPDPLPTTETDGVVIYEANPYFFARTDALQAVAARLNEIQELGVNVIWLMPVYELGRKNAVGSPYCVRNYFQLNADYGTLDDLKSLVNQAHAKGIRVILDWVANHTAWDNEWINNKSWYTQDAAGNIISPAGMGWGDVADLNYDNVDMRAAMLDAMKFWITETDVDGYRCDYADGVPHDFWRTAIAELKTLKGDELLMLAEGSEYSLFTDGFDIVWGWEFATRLQSLFAGSGSVASLYKANADEYNGVLGGKQRLRYSTNHDVASGASPLQMYDGTRGAMAAFVIATTISGVPLIYSSQEIGYPQALSFFGYHAVNWNSNADYLQEYKRVMQVYRSSVALQKGSLRTYEKGNVACYYRSHGNEGVLVVVNTSDETVDLRTPIEFAGIEATDLLNNTAITLPANMSLEAYRYCFYQIKN
ncbi:MAG: alpha-glucosidase C-terminal domain-containing protein [Prevotellaceae bacterium]|jgi:glycosidase|nr:alpha-glucosidase C-terminal domain-containing protein [Prevotellaceae bacterium]